MKESVTVTENVSLKEFEASPVSTYSTTTPTTATPFSLPSTRRFSARSNSIVSETFGLVLQESDGEVEDFSPCTSDLLAARGWDLPPKVPSRKTSLINRGDSLRSIGGVKVRSKVSLLRSDLRFYPVLFLLTSLIKSKNATR